VEAHGDVEGFVASVHDNDFPLEAISSLIEEKEKEIQTYETDKQSRFTRILRTATAKEVNLS
jgi:hypothetical protein